LIIIWAVVLSGAFAIVYSGTTALCARFPLVCAASSPWAEGFGMGGLLVFASLAVAAIAVGMR
jgi:hypothetical protein